MQWEMNIAGITLYELLATFFIYSFVGWAWESCLVSVREGRWVNRGFVTGPVCAIYGTGAISDYLIFHNHTDNVYLLFFGGMIAATAIEYVAACLLELVFHTSWWDYSVQPLNFQGRICPYATLGWGVVAVLFYRTMQPTARLLIRLVPVDTGKFILSASICIFVFDLSVTGLAAFDLKDRLMVFERTYFKEILDGGVRKRVEEYLGKAGQLRNKFIEALGTASYTARRMARAYPNLKSSTKLARDVALHHIMRIGKSFKIT